MSYYDGTKLLSLKDINGEKPELYICTSNRTGGKTTYFGRLVVNRFNKHGEKFMLLYRFNYELDDIANKFYKDIKSLFFNGTEMTSKKRAKGIYHELFIDNNHCGYAVALNNADQVKKYSHLFSDTACMVFDEFQSETNHYCSEEIRKFLSIHTSVARGQGKQRRYVPVYMIGNPISLINPYYTELGISSRLTENTKFLKGNGFVVEQGFVQSACEAQTNSGIQRAFFNNEYTAYAKQGVYLNDNKAFIEKIEGFPRYMCTLKYKNKWYAIKEYADMGIIYCDDNADKNFPNKISVTTDDHQTNFVMLKRNDLFLLNMRYYFEHGCFRFKDLSAKEAVLSALSY